MPPAESAPSSSRYRVVVGICSGTLSGVDVFSATLVRGLGARGVSAHVLRTRPEVRWNPMPLPADVPRHELKGERREPWGSRWWTMIRYLESQAPCIYIPNYDYEYSCVCPKLSPGVCVVGIVHSDDPDHYEHVARLGSFWDAVVAVTPVVAARTVELDPSLADRLFTIPYGVALPEAIPPRPHAALAPLRIVFAGRLEQAQKRILDLPRILERLEARGVPFEATIVGDGQSREELVRACERLIGRGSVRLTGTLPNQEVLGVFDQSDVFLLASAFEGLPVSLLEAMSRGCVPVVADVRSGIPDLVEDGVNGFRVPVADIDAFADKLALLQGQPERRRNLSLQAFRDVRERGYGSELMVERYEALFERVLARSRRGEFRRPRGRILHPAHLADVTWKDRLPPRLRAVGTSVIGGLRRALRRRDRAFPFGAG
jgi:glycosyltransferase involved in cell wall biosynthesis